LGWAFFNMVLSVVIAFGFGFETYAALETSLFIPIFCGLWIVFFTLGALTLDSNVLMACRNFSKPLRRMLKPNSKDSKDQAPKVSTSGGEIENSGAKMSHSSTIFIVNREMFPTKYDDFDPEVLDQIIQELKFQLNAVRRAVPSGTTTVVELADTGHRNSTQINSAHRLSSQPKFGLAPPSSDSRGSSQSSESSPRNIAVMVPEPLYTISPLAKTSESSGSSNSSEISQNVIVVIEPLAKTTSDVAPVEN